jgi:prolyl 4-hydroxylase
MLNNNLSNNDKVRGDGITKEWLKWIDENLQRKCNIKEIKKNLEKTFSTHPQINQILADRIRLSKTIEKIKFPTEKLDLYLIKNFLTRKECQDIIQSAKGHCIPSTITTQKTEKDLYFRTSSTCHYTNLTAQGQKFLDKIDQKICNQLQLSSEFSELIQIQHYLQGNEFKLHHDFFDSKSSKEIEKKGNRTWTFMVFLNDVEKGGETFFKTINVKFQPKQGMALLWNNLHENGLPNHNTLHAGLPVIAGEKYIITKWFRELR